jgi:hypothetical protein
MKKIIVLINFVLCFNFVEAQNWVSLADATVGVEGSTLFSDSLTGKLFVGGNLVTTDGHHSYVIAAWDGSAWDTTYSFRAYDSRITSMARCQNELYTCGLFLDACYNYCDGFTRWNGNCWDSLITTYSNNLIGDLCVYNNLLYCVGIIGPIDTIYSPLAVAWNGNNFIANGLPHSGSNGSGPCCVFNNSIYIAGNFSDSLGLLYGFVKYDGTNWSMPDPGFGGLVQSMAVYNNELYIGGNNFVNSPNDFLVKWNGTTLSSVGNEFYGEAFHLRVIGDKLFAVGGIDSADGIPIHDNIAVWDGSHWSDFSNDTINNAVMDVAVYNNEFYALGAFTMINGDSIGGVAKYQDWYLGEKEIKMNKGVEVYLNPTNTTLNIHLSSYAPNETLLITDVLGEVIYKGTLSGIDNSIDVSMWSEGVYFYEVISTNTIARGKFMKVN